MHIETKARFHSHVLTLESRILPRVPRNAYTEAFSYGLWKEKYGKNAVTTVGAVESRYEV